MESKKLKVYNDVTIPAEPRGNGDLFFCGDESQGSLSRDVINASINSPKANLNYYIRNNFKPFSYNEINHQGAFYKFLYLGTEDTLVTLTTEHYSIPDRFQVFYNGERYYDSGFSGDSRIISFQYKYDPNKSRFLVLEMDAPNRGTDWWVRSKCD